MDKMKERKQSIPVWVWIIIIALIFFWIFSPGNSKENIEDYSSCVDWCVSDIGDCAGLSYIIDKDGETWLYGWDFETCFGDLEGCIEDCEYDYLD
ncbi:MAG: hypothetical protein U9Q06_01240 [Nanoarchaeota archaeon]|nr:hypothetical protein [Nanoarchaeota archaeon]